MDRTIENFRTSNSLLSREALDLAYPKAVFCDLCDTIFVYREGLTLVHSFAEYECGGAYVVTDFFAVGQRTDIIYFLRYKLASPPDNDFVRLINDNHITFGGDRE